MRIVLPADIKPGVGTLTVNRFAQVAEEARAHPDGEPWRRFWPTRVVSGILSVWVSACLSLIDHSNVDIDEPRCKPPASTDISYRNLEFEESWFWIIKKIFSSLAELCRCRGSTRLGS